MSIWKKLTSSMQDKTREENIRPQLEEKYKEYQVQSIQTKIDHEKIVKHNLDILYNQMQKMESTLDSKINMIISEIKSLTYENKQLKKITRELAEHLLIEKAKTSGLDVVRVAQLYNSPADGDKEIAIALVNDRYLTEALYKLKEERVEIPPTYADDPFKRQQGALTRTRFADTYGLFNQ